MARQRDRNVVRVALAFASALRRLRGPVLAPAAPPAVGGDADLLCTRCRSTALCPMQWAPEGESGWFIEARCGECGAWDELRLSNREAARFDVVLDDQVALIATAVDRLEAERAARDFETLIEALRHDLITPADITGHRAA